MISLYLFIGEIGSQQEFLFDMLPNFNDRQTLFNKIIVKYQYQQQYLQKNILLIKFPEVRDLENEIQNLLILIPNCCIKQFIIFIKNDQSIIKKINNLKHLINQQIQNPKNNMFTFFVNQSLINEFDKQNRVYYFQNFNTIDLQQVIYWLNSNSLNEIKITNLEQVQQNLSSQIIQQIDNAQNSFTYFLRENKNHQVSFVKILENLEQPSIEYQSYTNTLQQEIRFYYSLILLSIQNSQTHFQSYLFQDKNFTFEQIKYCNTCKIIYWQKNQTWTCNRIYLDKFCQTEINIGYIVTCIQSNSYVVPIYQQNQIYVSIQNKKDNDSLSNFQYNIDNKPKNALSIILLSCEENQKSYIFQNAYKQYQQEKNQFQIGTILKNNFYLIDSPFFKFEPDSEKLEQEFKQFLSINPINYIFFCISYQRTSLMKDKLLDMLKILVNVNYNQMGVIIKCFKNKSFNSAKEIINEAEIIKSMQNILKQIMIITENDSSEDIIDKIQNCIKDLDFSKTLSFKDTIFNSEEDQQTQDLIQQQLSQITQQVKIKIKTECEKEIFYQQSKLQALEQDKEKLENQMQSIKQIYRNTLEKQQYKIAKLIEQIEEEKYNYDKDYNILSDKYTQIKQQIRQISVEQQNRKLDYHRMY